MLTTSCVLIAFQSTLSQGERHGGAIKVQSMTDISIHALARRATLVQENIVDFVKHFNPRSRKESDFLLYVHVPLLSNFNPRSRKESDSNLQIRIYH